MNAPDRSQGDRDAAKASIASIFRMGVGRRAGNGSSVPGYAYLSAAEEATLAVDDAGIVRYGSPGAEAVFRLPAASLAGRALSDLIPGLRFNAATPGFNRFLALFWSARRGWMRLEARSEARGTFQVDATLTSVQIASARLFVVGLRDAETLRPAPNLVRRITAAVAESDDAVMLTDAEGVIEYVNPGFERITGYSSEEAVGRTPHLLSSGSHPLEFHAALWATLRAGREFRGAIVNRRKDGSLYHEEKSIRPLFDDAGAVTHYLSVGRDVTERVERMARLECLAQHDELTGLANRSLFRDRLRQAIASAARHRGGFALLYLDLDDFKALNDGCGHACGDAALKEVARRLRGSLREEDTVARVGGDEFAIILAGVDDPEAARAPLQKILGALRAAMPLGDRSAVLGASIGACLYPGHGRDENELMSAADTAMYRAKTQGVGYVFAGAAEAVERGVEQARG